MSALSSEHRTKCVCRFAVPEGAISHLLHTGSDTDERTRGPTLECTPSQGCCRSAMRVILPVVSDELVLCVNTQKITNKRWVGRSANLRERTLGAETGRRLGVQTAGYRSEQSSRTHVADRRRTMNTARPVHTRTRAPHDARNAARRSTHYTQYHTETESGPVD